MTNESDSRGRSSGEQSGSLRARVPHESFEGTAVFMGIPRESWQDPEIQRFVGLVNRVRQLQEDLTIADAGNMSSRIDPQRYLELNRGLKPPLSDRYSSAELLMRVAIQILEQGFNGAVVNPDYLQGKLNVAVGGYGLKVEKK